ncbi:MAG: ATP-binding protein, partial [Rhodoglobus sp.]
GDDALGKAEAQHIELRIGETDAWIWTDPVWLERVLRNLMDNAIKYTLRGSVCLECEDDGDKVRITIRDTGLGIAPDNQQRVFQEYFQVHNASRDRANGVGLGLAIVKRACDLLGHPITLRSELGVGSEFVITLPRIRDAVMTSPDPTADIANASGEFDGLVVVVVEDDREVAQATHAVLEEWRCIPVSCTGAEDAIWQLEAQGLTPHAVIADYRLAGVATGSDAIALLRREFGALPAALLTGEVNAAELQNPDTAHCAVLQKPLTAAKLRDLLRGFRSASVASASASVG